MAAKHARSSSRSRRAPVSSFGSRTDIGCVRDHNEDSLIVAPPLYVVADGMGGHAAGEVASEIAVDVISRLAPEHPDGEALAFAVEEANRAIIQAASEGQGRAGMGTTCTAAMMEGERLVIAQVGDSRAYLLHNGKLQQITRDHSLMADMIESGQITPEEARVHPRRSVITRALGSDANMCADIYEINVKTGDRLLLCSDGLSGMLEDHEMEAVLLRTRDPQRCAAQLVNQAIGAGGYDNVTVVVADVTGFAESQRKKVALKTKVFVAFVLVLFAAILAGTAFACHTYLNTVAYLAADNGKVAIYRGLPDEVLGMSFSNLERTTDVSVSDLQPGVANRLEEGIRVDSVEAAEQLVSEYERDIAERSGQNLPASANKGKTDEADGADSADTAANSEANATDGASGASATNNSSAQGGEGGQV
ncbi:Stp1/IreP family PP2C-type Ser/Thr phosphatase [Adlercreutzia sp. ZJ138]|uniref:Stp1/IreP family PP2C-type Ser/Thr phosphatase n=1 Tax=Adlercreutzia sp. ZJ138 TaxID=2709405 RepID=UPI0013EA5103|nr:Stp1/IreP family PP2C-type Ser/Thr phosphatase [Adlercreutzia sp. ZJ138]